MEYGYYEQSGSPFQGAQLEKLRAFLLRMGLTYDPGITYTATIRSSGDEIVAAGSCRGMLSSVWRWIRLFRGKGLPPPSLQRCGGRR